MSLDDRIAQLVRDAVEPMLTERFEHLEERLVARLQGLVSEPDAVPSLLTAGDVAGLLRVAPRTVQRMVAAGEFPRPIPITPGRARWRRSDVDAWLEQRGTE